MQLGEIRSAGSRVCALFWFSRGTKLAGVKEKVCIWEFWGSSLRTPGSLDIVWGRQRFSRWFQALGLPDRCAANVKARVCKSASHRSYFHVTSVIGKVCQLVYVGPRGIVVRWTLGCCGMSDIKRPSVVINTFGGLVAAGTI